MINGVGTLKTKARYVIANRSGQFFNVQRGQWVDDSAFATAFPNVMAARAYADEFGLGSHQYHYEISNSHF